MVIGSFSDINWAGGPYFLKTEIDPEGGTSYNIIGITQLLSVPYALFAKSVSNEADPLFAVSPSSGISGTNITNWNTAFSWGDHVGLYRPILWIPSWTDITDKPIEFDPTSHSHSTADIIANQGRGDGGTYAARICNELQITEDEKTYGDWYLPSKAELNLMYQNRTTINASAIVNGGSSFAVSHFWSSAENDDDSAWRQFFSDGNQSSGNKGFPAKVRAVRYF